MSRLKIWQALWALASISTLAPSFAADGNIGCLFSASLCLEGTEWCYDDYAFGKCIPIYGSQPEDGSLYRYDMSATQLQWFEDELQRLAAEGYRWEHSYTQCILQAMLYTLQQGLDPSQVNAKTCDHLANENNSENKDNEDDVEPDETAYVRFTPNSVISDSDYANEVYNPPLAPGQDPMGYLPKGEPGNSGETVDAMHNNKGLPAITPFEGFRERLQLQQKSNAINAQTPMLYAIQDKEKKSLPSAEDETDSEPVPNPEYNDEERLLAHFRKFKSKVSSPYTAEYITQNRFSPLDAEVRSNALEKYKQSFAEKNFPFEYEENPGNDIPEPRITFSDDYVAEFSDAHPYDPCNKPNNSKNLEHVIKCWQLMNYRLKPQQTLYAEGGPLNTDDLQGSTSSHKGGVSEKHNNHDHNDYQHDPSYAFVQFKNSIFSNWDSGISFIRKLEKMLDLENNTFTDPRIELDEVTFRVENNSQGYNASDVAIGIDNIKDEVQRQAQSEISSTGVGDKSKHPLIRYTGAEMQLLGLDLSVALALLGSMSVLLVGVVVFALLLKRDISTKRKMQGLPSANEIDAEATRDYQELCRARMSEKWSGQQTAAASPHPGDHPQRISSISREPDGNSPSTRSSTSSWSEEPALTNMDISTGHMVLAYMEDHLRNKDRLEQEWRALCAYEAEPCATTAALKPENAGKNRYADVLPYDHSRVSLNTLSNHLGSDYINASTITDHDPRNPAYIAAAGPLAQTAPDFWQMVWEQGSVVMVMLTRLTENGQQLCHRYWPEDGSELYHIYEVHLVSEHIWCDDHLVRSFYLKNQRTGETRTVTQFHFLSWPENGVPSSTKALLEFRRKVNKSYRGRSCPIVVHCSDGAGRTGTYCLIDMVLNRMAKGAKEIDIAATLEHIRDQRSHTVATKQQFEFVLMAVAEEVHAILKALPAHLAQLQEKKDKEKEKEKDKDGNEKEK